MSKSSINWPEDDIASQAAYWITVLQSEQCSDVDHKSFGHWVESSEAHKDAFQDLLEAWHGCETFRDDPDFISLRREALSPAKTKSRLYHLMALAAMLLVSLTIGLVTYTPKPETPITQKILANAVSSAPQQSLQELATAIGERSIITLEDGSTVELNTDTVVRIKFTNEERRLYLLKGQALFSVAHDKSRPFVVYAGARRVTALGTEFEVKFTDTELPEVTLLKGSVKVDDLEIKPEKVEIVVQRTVELVPGERLRENLDVPEVLAEDNLQRSLSWREGKLVFVGEMLGDVVNEINRYSTYQVVLADPYMNTLPITGTFKAGNSMVFAESVSINFGLHQAIDRNNLQIIISNK